jgi:7-keto-8-aminopelargonate synthetase-like enzyme
MRNTRKLKELSSDHLQQAVQHGLMQETILSREGKEVELSDGSRVVEFINCSYLGLDTHPLLLAGACRAVEEWGVHFCCARSRFTIAANRELEEQLSSLYGARAITFPSVTAAHMAALPLAASGVLLNETRPVVVVYDRFAHASTQYLKPILAAEAQVETIAHNDLEALRDHATKARSHGKVVLYIADGVYSMGGISPVRRLAEMAEELDFYVYLDDAHGTSILGRNGVGYALSLLGELPERFVLTYSLAKGFGCNGGGLLVPRPEQESAVRSYGMTYAFSAPLDFSIVGAALESVNLHRDGTVARLQNRLWERVRLVRPDVPEGLYSPIVMIPVGKAERAIELGIELKRRGIFVSTVFFPTVPRGSAQLRLAVTAEHTPEQLGLLVDQLRDLGLSWT